MYVNFSNRYDKKEQIMQNREILLSINKESNEKIKTGQFSELIIEEMIPYFTKTGSTAIDCGAADGRFLARMWKSVGNDEGAVIAFEALDFLTDILKKRFNHPRYRIFNCAISNEEGEAIFNFARNRRWVSSLSADGLDQYDVEKRLVRVIRLDSFLPSIGINNDSISFIKLDIEGAEFDALCGGRKTIIQSQPIITFENGREITSKRFNYSKRDFFKFFESINYDLIDIFGTPFTSENWNNKDIPWNFIAAPFSIMPNVRLTIEQIIDNLLPRILNY